MHVSWGLRIVTAEDAHDISALAPYVAPSETTVYEIVDLKIASAGLKWDVMQNIHLFMLRM